MAECERRGFQDQTFALNPGLWPYVLWMKDDRGRTLKLRIGVSDGAIKKATLKPR
jgi:hypothetical protein